MSGIWSSVAVGERVLFFLEIQDLTSLSLIERPRDHYSHSPPKLGVKKQQAAKQLKFRWRPTQSKTIIEQLLECQLKITAESEDDAETCPLLVGNPFFDVVITKSYLNPLYQMLILTKMYPELPSATIPPVFTYRGKKWKMVYSGGSKPIRIHREDWKFFTQDNDVKIGDACVFEFMECSSDHLEFKVQIPQGDFPAELLQCVKGHTETNPMIIE